MGLPVEYGESYRSIYTNINLRLILAELDTFAERRIAMIGFLYGISIIWVVIGSCCILYTTQCRSILKKMLKGLNLKFLALLAIIIGILLIFSAWYSRNFWFIVFLGLITIGKGILFFLNPGNTAEKILNWSFDTASDQTYRFFGIVFLIIGTAVSSWVL